MKTAKLFQNGQSQAVRLPKAVAFPENVHRVEILRLGRSRLVVPEGERWDDFFLTGPHVSDDFLTDRVQPAAEEREPF